MREIHLTLAERECDCCGSGCIERASTVRQSERIREGHGCRSGRARVAYRYLGDTAWNSQWRYSCRTPERERDEAFNAGDFIGDGSDAAMIAWVTGVARGEVDRAG